MKMISSFLLSIFVMLFGTGLTAYGFKHVRQNYQAIKKQMEINHAIAAPVMRQLESAPDANEDKQPAWVF
jgi:uncharacterized membrane protein YidH (DUF202 family)